MTKTKFFHGITPAPLVGMAIGDALGMPFEMFPATHPEILSWDGSFQDYKPHTRYHSDLKAGQWTDDTQMATLLTRVLVENKGYNQLAALKKYMEWATSNPRGIGGTLKKSLTDAKTIFDFTGELRPCPVTGPEVRGNGVVMRIAPLGAYCAIRRDGDRYLDMAVLDATLTHNGPASCASAIKMARMVRILHDLNGRNTLMEDGCEVVSPFRPTTDMTTWMRARMCFLMTDNFASAVQAAVRLGGDTDTVAACTGALAGTWYGMEGIPQSYLEGLEDAQGLKSLQDELYALGDQTADDAPSGS